MALAVSFRSDGRALRWLTNRSRQAGDNPEVSAISRGFLDNSTLDRVCNYLAMLPASRATPPAAMKNTADIQACGSGSLFVAIATVIVSAAIPDMNAIVIQHQKSMVRRRSAIY